MYYYLEGKLTHCDPQTAVIDCGGVGYQCNITLNTCQALQGEKHVRLYTYLHVKEDALTLYGFADEEEKKIFLLLLSITGVGPKAALAILSEMLPDAFAAAVVAGDYRRITKANGVGPKLAQRICLELKDKIAKTNVRIAEGQVNVPGQDRATFDDAVSVLASLGYSRNDAEAALEKCTADNVNDLVRQALRMLSAMI